MGNKTPAFFQIEHHTPYGSDILLKGKSIAYVRPAFFAALDSLAATMMEGDSVRLTQGGRIILQHPPVAPNPMDADERARLNAEWDELRKAARRGRRRVFK